MKYNDCQVLCCSLTDAVASLQNAILSQILKIYILKDPTGILLLLKT